MPRPPQSQALPELTDQLARWTTAALIDPAQARRIAEYETARAGAPSPGARAGQRRLPLVAEVLGYVGAVIAVTALVVTAHQFWPRIPASVELAFAGVAAVLLAAAGVALRVGGEPAFARLRSVLWLLATAAAAAFAAVLTDRFLHLSGDDVDLLTAVTWTACAIPLWWRCRAGLLQLSMFAGSVAVVETAVGRFVDNPPDWELGLSLWALSVLWGAAALRGYLAPRTAGLAAGAAGALVGAIMTDDTTAGLAFTMATVAGLLAAGIASRKVSLLGIGAAGLVYVVPEAATRYLPGSAAASFAVALVGLALLTLAIWLARSRTTQTRATSPPRP